MRRKGSTARDILSAGEIGGFTVCPEAYRLRVVERRPEQRPENMEEGSDLHAAWAQEVDDFVYLTRAVKVVTFVVAVTAFIYMMS